MSQIPKNVNTKISRANITRLEMLKLKILYGSQISPLQPQAARRAIPVNPISEHQFFTALPVSSASRSQQHSNIAPKLLSRSPTKARRFQVSLRFSAVSDSSLISIHCITEKQNRT